MSMVTLTIIQTIAVFIAYLAVTTGVPYLLIKNILSDFSKAAVFLIAFLCGNFFVINLVLVLQLLHISNRFTLTGATLVAIAFVALRFNRFNISYWAFCQWDSIIKYSKKEIGSKTVIKNTIRHFRLFVLGNLKRLAKAFIYNPLEAILFIFFVLSIFYLYGQNILHSFGYCASDIIVHNYWINAMGEGDLFVAGVYPFGFHCTIYYLHTVFGLQTYVLLRLFCLVQTFLIHLILFVFLKELFMTRYLAYAGVILYTLADIYPTHTYSRYASSLPQEFGMLFILPSVYFGFKFFDEKRRELTLQKNYGFKHYYKSNWCLVAFAMSFSMSLAAHFYDTMIAGIFCIAMAIGYGFRFIQWKYFKRVVLTCIIAVAIAVLPMAIAYMGGTKLQGSLGWGMNVISGTSSDDTETEASIDSIDAEIEADIDDELEEEEETDDSAEVSLPVITYIYFDEFYKYELSGYSLTDTTSGAKWRHIKWYTASASCRPRIDTLIDNTISNLNIITSCTKTYVLKSGSRWLFFAIPLAIGLLIVLSALFFMLRLTSYAAKMLTIAANAILLLVTLSAGRLGILKLMDASRASIYFAYFLPILIFMALDALIVLFLTRKGKKWLWNLSSLTITIALIVAIFATDSVKASYSSDALITNEAVICLTNILRENEDFTWTIVSANDELRMGEDYGYHTEIIELLSAMETYADAIDYTIPTKYVYFFIEKVPVDYSSSYDGSGQSISIEGASRSLPLSSNLTQYQGERRWIIMSRMYYWAQSFIELYPTEMSVYFENENFVCYKLTQNVNNLFNLCIDYGYNTQD